MRTPPKSSPPFLSRRRKKAVPDGNWEKPHAGRTSQRLPGALRAAGPAWTWSTAGRAPGAHFPLTPINPHRPQLRGRSMAGTWLPLLQRFTSHRELLSDLRPSFRYVMKTETWFWVSSPNSHRAGHGERHVKQQGQAALGLDRVARPQVLFQALPPMCVA